MHTYTRARQFVSERGGADEDDIHTQKGMAAMDIRWYSRRVGARQHGPSSPATTQWKNTQKPSTGYVHPLFILTDFKVASKCLPHHSNLGQQYDKMTYSLK